MTATLDVLTATRAAATEAMRVYTLETLDRIATYEAALLREGASRYVERLLVELEERGKVMRRLQSVHGQIVEACAQAFAIAVNQATTEVLVKEKA